MYSSDQDAKTGAGVDELTPEEQAELAALCAGNPNKPQRDFKFDFGDESSLERAVLGAILFDDGMLARFRKLVEPKYFVNKGHHLICQVAFDLFDRYKQPASFELLRTELQHVTKAKSDRAFYLAELQTLMDGYVHGQYPPEYMFERVAEFARTQQFRFALNDSVDILRGGKPDKWDKIKDLFAAPLSGATFVSGVSAVESFDQFMTSVDDEPQFVIEDFLEAGMLMLLAGDAKGGKTTLMVNTAIDAALEGEAVGEKAKSVPIVYLDYENRRHNLKRTINKALQGRDPSPLNGVFHIASRHVPRKAAADHQALPEYVTVPYLKEVAARHDAPGIIVLDTFAGAFRNTPRKPDRWENDPGFIGGIFRPIQEWCHDSDWCVIVLHHTNAQGGIRGTTEFRGAVDAIVFFTRKDGERTVTLKIDGRFGDAIDSKQLEFKDGRYFYQGTVSEAGKAAKASEELNVRNMVVECFKARLEGATAGTLRDEKGTLITDPGCTKDDVQEFLERAMKERGTKVGKNATYAHIGVLKDCGVIHYDSGKKRNYLNDGWETVYAMLEESKPG